MAMTLDEKVLKVVVAIFILKMFIGLILDIGVANILHKHKQHFEAAFLSIALSLALGIRTVLGLFSEKARRRIMQHFETKKDKAAQQQATVGNDTLNPAFVGGASVLRSPSQTSEVAVEIHHGEQGSIVDEKEDKPLLSNDRSISRSSSTASLASLEAFDIKALRIVLRELVIALLQDAAVICALASSQIYVLEHYSMLIAATYFATFGLTFVWLTYLLALWFEGRQGQYDFGSGSGACGRTWARIILAVIPTVLVISFLWLSMERVVPEEPVTRRVKAGITVGTCLSWAVSVYMLFVLMTGQSVSGPRTSNVVVTFENPSE